MTKSIHQLINEALAKKSINESKEAGDIASKIKSLDDETQNQLSQDKDAMKRWEHLTGVSDFNAPYNKRLSHSSHPVTPELANRVKTLVQTHGHGTAENVLRNEYNRRAPPWWNCVPNTGEMKITSIDMPNGKPPVHFAKICY